ncbi:MAG: adenylate/guanylate cyclase domain-containing protein, partial [Fulvivirga sp.]|uniref:adenylate/guanylate cyclase domain-containing protein n=1 Tax=Fulvivirga sp. TaxID=1931237 RepID=UPI0032EBBA50
MTRKKTLLQRVADIGVRENFLVTEKRYLQVSNIAAMLGVLFNTLWMSIALSISEITSAVWNGVLGLMFLMVMVLNRKGSRVVASVWLASSAYISVLVFLYLSGYGSGITTVCFLIIILPYMTFPRKARALAHGFSVMACLTLIIAVAFQSEFYAHNDMDPYLSQIVNMGMTAFICLALIWSLSVLIDRSEDSLIAEQKKSDDLLHNILPKKIIKDLKVHGKTIPKRHEHVSILFTDFEGFTELVATIPAITLVNELNDIFGRFDEIMEETGMEKIETIGDAYMAACGLEDEITNHAVTCVRAAQKMQSYLEERNKNHKLQWNMRVGIHSGAVVAGVVGKKKFAYDLFGDTINTASRMESAG